MGVFSVGLFYAPLALLLLLGALASWRASHKSRLNARAVSQRVEWHVLILQIRREKNGSYNDRRFDCG
jgi:hypothetical protein